MTLTGKAGPLPPLQIRQLVGHPGQRHPSSHGSTPQHTDAAAGGRGGTLGKAGAEGGVGQTVESGPHSQITSSVVPPPRFSDCSHVQVSSWAQLLSTSSHEPTHPRPNSQQYSAQLRPLIPEATYRLQLLAPHTSPRIALHWRGAGGGGGGTSRAQSEFRLWYDSRAAGDDTATIHSWQSRKNPVKVAAHCGVGQDVGTLQSACSERRSIRPLPASFLEISSSRWCPDPPAPNTQQSVSTRSTAAANSAAGQGCCASNGASANRHSIAHGRSIAPAV